MNHLERILKEYRSKLDVHDNITDRMKDALTEYVKNTCIEYAKGVVPEYELIEGDPSMPYNMSLVGYNTALENMRLRIDQDLLSLNPPKG